MHATADPKESLDQKPVACVSRAPPAGTIARTAPTIQTPRTRRRWSGGYRTNSTVGSGLCAAAAVVKEQVTGGARNAAEGAASSSVGRAGLAV